MNDINKEFYKLIRHVIKRANMVLDGLNFVSDMPLSARNYQKARISQHVETLEYLKNEHQKLRRKIKKD